MLIPIGDINKRETFPWVNYTLLAVNVVVSLWFFLYAGEETDYEEVVYRFGFRASEDPSEWTVLTVLTSMFLHAGWGHLFGNMLVLWIAGDNVEDRFGHIPYLLFYLASGAAAAFAHAWMCSEDMAALPAIGASGAIGGVMGAYLLLFPKSRIRMIFWIWFIIIPFHVPSWVLIFIWAALEGLRAWLVYQGELTTNVAVWAHLGGFSFGLAAGFLWYLLAPFRSKDKEGSR